MIEIELLAGGGRYVPRIFKEELGAEITHTYHKYGEYAHLGNASIYLMTLDAIHEVDCRWEYLRSDDAQNGTQELYEKKGRFFSTRGEEFSQEDVQALLKGEAYLVQRRINDDLCPWEVVRGSLPVCPPSVWDTL